MVLCFGAASAGVVRRLRKESGRHQCEHPRARVQVVDADPFVWLVGCRAVTRATNDRCESAPGIPGGVCCSSEARDLPAAGIELADHSLDDACEVVIVARRKRREEQRRTGRHIDTRPRFPQPVNELLDGRSGALDPAASWLHETQRAWDSRLGRLKRAVERQA